MLTSTPNSPILIRTLAFIIFNFVFTSIFYAQTHPCGTELLYNNENSPQLPTTNPENVTPRNTYSLPVAIHIIQNENSHANSFHACEPTAEVKLVLDDLADANELFKPHDIQFFLCGEINFIRSNLLNAINMDVQSETNRFNSYNIRNVINIYYVHSIYSEYWRVGGYAYFPWTTTTPHIVMARKYLPNKGKTLAHELGHFFGLFHPHHTRFGSELVDGSNCHEAGDLLCDTPADPNLYGKINDNCQYNQFELDSIGIPYAPNTQLIMSYADSRCKDLFSPQQVSKMKEVYEQYYSHYACNPHIQEKHITIYPNPASELLHIGAIDDVAMEIFDASGRFYPPVPASEKCLDVSFLSNGLYFIRISIPGSQEGQIFKFVVKH